jgi:hypothetical protein
MVMRKRHKIQTSINQERSVVENLNIKVDAFDGAKLGWSTVIPIGVDEYSGLIIVPFGPGQEGYDWAQEYRNKTQSSICSECGQEVNDG